MTVRIARAETATGYTWRAVARYRGRAFAAYHRDRATAVRDAILAHA